MRKHAIDSTEVNSCRGVVIDVEIVSVTSVVAIVTKLVIFLLD